MPFDELASEFSSEAEVLLDRLERSLLQVQAAQGEAELHAASRDARRDLHTLKGNAALLGAVALEKALHLLEDEAETLDRMPDRAGRMLSALDALRAEVREIGSGRPVDAASEAVLKLASGGALEAADAALDVAADLGSEVRVSRERLDALLAAAGELVVTNAQLQRLLAGGSASAAATHHWLDRLDRTTRLLHELVLGARTLPLRRILSRFERLVRDEGRRAGKQVELRVHGEQVEVDRVVLEALTGPLLHLLRNAVVHGIESPEVRRARGKPEQGTVRLEAATVGQRVHIAVSDDGAGLDREAIARRARERGLPEGLTAEQLIFLPGFSTSSLTTSAGRGVGLDVVARAISELGGTLQVDSSEERGTQFLLSVPASLALQRAILCSVGGEVYAVPASAVLEVVRASQERIRWVGRGFAFEHGGVLVPLVDTGRVLGVRAREGGYVLVLHRGGAIALTVDALLGQQDFVFQPLPPDVRGQGPVSGAALLGDGRVVLRIDPERLVRAAFRAPTEVAAMDEVCA